METKIVTVAPWSREPDAGVWRTTVPAGSVVSLSGTGSGTKPARVIARSACSWVWPTTLGTSCGPSDQKTVMVVPEATAVPGAGSVRSTWSTSSSESSFLSRTLKSSSISAALASSLFIPMT